MDKLLRNVGDLPTPERSAVEAIIGHTLRDDQQLYIVALDAAIEPTEATRREAWSELEEIIAESHQNVRQSGVSQEELERTIDETCDEVRYGK
jgi:hypothetical protein